MANGKSAIEAVEAEPCSMSEASKCVALLNFLGVSEPKASNWRYDGENLIYYWQR